MLLRSIITIFTTGIAAIIVLTADSGDILFSAILSTLKFATVVVTVRIAVRALPDILRME